MTDQPPIAASSKADPGRQIAQLRHILGLVEQISSRTPSGASDAALNDAARVSAAYEEALPVARRRFDALAAETSAWASIGVGALLTAGRNGPLPQAAAATLAEELERALEELAALLH